MAQREFQHNDADAIYNRMVIKKIKNARMAWAARMARKRNK